MDWMKIQGKLGLYWLYMTIFLIIIMSVVNIISLVSMTNNILFSSAFAAWLLVILSQLSLLCAVVLTETYRNKDAPKG